MFYCSTPLLRFTELGFSRASVMRKERKGVEAEEISEIGVGTRCRGQASKKWEELDGN
jgi:hypothetical protein